MTFDNRQYALAGVAVVVGAATALVLVDVLATVFFAMTVALALTPIYRLLRDRGVPRSAASAITTILAFLGGVLVFVPIAIVLYLRRAQLFAFVRSIPESVTLVLFETTVTIHAGDVEPVVIGFLRGLLLDVAALTPVLLVKAGLFALVLYALFEGQSRVQAVVEAIVPDGYHDVLEALERRAHETVFAIYVLQAATAVGTFLIAVPVFEVLGYDYPFALATLSGILQFVPILGPSLVIGGLALAHLSASQVEAAILVVIVGGGLIAWLPDMLIRPPLARRTADLSGALYFVGFIGGVFSLGPIGIIAGPLIVALFVETVSLLGTEMSNGSDPDGPGRTPDDATADRDGRSDRTERADGPTELSGEATGIDARGGPAGSREDQPGPNAE